VETQSRHVKEPVTTRNDEKQWVYGEELN